MDKINIASVLTGIALVLVTGVLVYFTYELASYTEELVNVNKQFVNISETQKEILEKEREISERTFSVSTQPFLSCNFISNVDNNSVDFIIDNYGGSFARIKRIIAESSRHYYAGVPYSTYSSNITECLLSVAILSSHTGFNQSCSAQFNIMKITVYYNDKTVECIK